MPLQQLLSNYWITVTALAVTVILPFILIYIHIKSTDLMSRVVHRAVRTYVFAVEFDMPEATVAQKHDAVNQLVDKFLDARHLRFPDEKIDAIIDAELFLLEHPELRD